MNTKTQTAIGLAAIIIISAVIALTANNYIPYNLSENFTITAHSGSENTEDNSMEFLEKCIEIDVRVLEIDLTFRADGTPVLLHKELPEENEGMLLEDALKYISENSDTVKINIDLKSVANLPQAVRLIEKYDMTDRCFYTGVVKDFVPAVKRDGGGLPYYLNVKFNILKKYSTKQLASIIDDIKSSGAIGINCNYKLASKKMVKLFRENGLLVSYWTANSEFVMKRLLPLEPDNITTRYPVKLREMAETE